MILLETIDGTTLAKTEIEARKARNILTTKINRVMDTIQELINQQTLPANNVTTPGHGSSLLQQEIGYTLQETANNDPVTNLEQSLMKQDAKGCSVGPTNNVYILINS